MQIESSLDWARKSTELRKLVKQVAGSQYDKSTVSMISQIQKKVEILSNYEVTARRTKKTPLAYQPLLNDINKDLEDIGTELFMIGLSG
jgi:hypothetical protein